MTVIIAGTFCRSDLSSLIPLLKRGQKLLRLVVSGSHLDPAYGYTLREIEEEGISIADTIVTNVSEDSASAICAALGHELKRFGDLFVRAECDLFLCVGDRIELLPAVTAALVNRVPVAHISGGDITEGSLDNQVRHAVSKMAHLHFVSMTEHKQRLIRMGEEEWRIHVVGDPALDRINTMKFLEREELAAFLGIELAPETSIVTLHPDSVSKSESKADLEEFFNALNSISGTLVFTAPNPDLNRSLIADYIQRFVSSHSNAVYVENLGQRRLYSLMSLATLMIGNSSSGIWEAPSFKLPVVNVGKRQQGRKRAGNVIDVDFDRQQILDGVVKARSQAFLSAISGISNPYGSGNACELILKVLEELPSFDKLFKKYEM